MVSNVPTPATARAIFVATGLWKLGGGAAAARMACVNSGATGGGSGGATVSGTMMSRVGLPQRWQNKASSTSRVPQLQTSAISTHSHTRTKAASGALWNEAVADSVDGQKMLRRVGVGLELLAELHDVRVDRTGIREELVAPDRIEDHVAGERTVGVL